MVDLKKDSKLLKLSGEYTIYEVSELCHSLDELLQNKSKVTIDLSSVERIDASFLQLLVSAKIEAEQNEVQLAFKNPSKTVVSLITSLHFQSLMEASSIEAAMVGESS